MNARPGLEMTFSYDACTIYILAMILYVDMVVRYGAGVPGILLALAMPIMGWQDWLIYELSPCL